MRMLTWLMLAFSINANAVDLRDYFPDGAVMYLNKANGQAQSKYSFIVNNPSLETIYNTYLNINRAGYPFYWRKEYWQNNAWCTATYGIMYKGSDQSIVEVGDWYASTPCTPNVVLGYKSGGYPTGLLWSPSGGLTETPVYKETNIWRQITPGGSYNYVEYQAYSKTGVIEILPTFKPKFGRKNGEWAEGNGTEYTEVVHVVMYHGTRYAPSPAPIRCDAAPLSAFGTYYQSFKNYNSYAIELWLVKGVGIIQERLPYLESGAEFNTTNCNGYVFNPESWEWYIDSAS
jgi:hypothetical protein